MSANDETVQRDIESVTDVELADGVEIDKIQDRAGEAQRDVNEVARAPRWLRAVVVVLLLSIASGLTAWLYFAQYRPDKETDSVASQAVVRAARDGTLALLSYKPATLDHDFATARSHLTGDFLKHYDQFTRQVVTPAAQQKGVTTSARILGAGVSELHPNSAVVLVFVDQITTSRDRPDPAVAATSVRVSLTRVDGTWLLSDFQPI